MPTGWIERLEVSRGPASAAVGTWRGARGAFMLEGAIGGVVGGEIASMGHETFFEAVPKRVVLYGLAGAVSGAVLGALNPGEDWVDISIYQLAAIPRPRGIFLALSIPFR